MTTRVPEGFKRTFLSGLVLCASTFVSACRQEPTYFHYGFKADILRPGEDGCDFGEPSWLEWAAGPHEEFDRIGPERLAASSMRWLERQRAKRDGDLLDLTFSYPSAGRDVRIRWARELDSTWQEQLEAWFERFPPTEDGASAPEGYTWHLAYAGRGEVQGRADSARTATETMLALADSFEPHAYFPEPTFGLGFVMQTGPRESSWFHVDGLREEVESLGSRLLEQRTSAGH